MFKRSWSTFAALSLLVLSLGVAASCSLALQPASQATATPTKTPRSPAAATQTPEADSVSLVLPTNSPVPTQAPTSTPLPSPSPVPPTPTELPPTASPTVLPAATRVPASPVPPKPTEPPQPSATPKPSVDFVIAELRVLGLGENNGGIEGIGAGRTIFVTVADAGGNPIDGAVIVNHAGYPGRAVSGDKGPGKAEILMDREVFQLGIESVAGQPVTSEVSHSMSLIEPLPQDIAGKLGDACPTVDNCPLPPYKHFSYVITFRRTR